MASGTTSHPTSVADDGIPNDLSVSTLKARAKGRRRSGQNADVEFKTTANAVRPIHVHWVGFEEET